MTVHSSHPFAGGPRDDAKALRGRLGSRVALVTAGEGRARAGWTVSSVMVLGGDPWQVLLALDPEADVVQRIASEGLAVIGLLGARHRRLADIFAELTPSPGGPFASGEWFQTPWGPRPADVDSWAGLELEESRDVGWSRLLTMRIAHVEAGPDPDPLHHHRGRYRTW